MPGFFILLSPHLRPGSLVNRASDSGSEGRGFESHPGHEGKEVSLIEKSRGLF